MGAREGMIVGSSLLAICFLVSDASQAAEPMQPGTPAASSPAPELPAFLDDKSLPALQEAWQAQEQAPEAAPQPQQSELPKGDVPATEDPTTVRQRAEELSRRFGTDGATSAPAEAPPSVTIPPAVVPAGPADQAKQESKQVVVKPDIPTRKPARTRVKAGTTAALPDKTKNALIGEKLRLAAPPPLNEDIPPLPPRAPKARGSDASAPGSAKKVATARVKKPVRANNSSNNNNNNSQSPPDPKAALRGSILTNELGAFGWDTQPE